MSDAMGMETLHLDGNAAAGLLSQLFVTDITAARATCSGCAAVAPVGALMLYAHEMGAVLRCTHCGQVMLRVSRTPTHVWLDASGSRSIAVRLPA
ncbi:MAG TPA: DUF6510 family protein [Gemmatimonadaceae bacterium]|nr:DUF6510 family protein [Gemmatimonadaceae bacterium]